MKYAFGVDYYPENWPKELWDKDIELMSNAHMNIVRLADFAWGRLEVSLGRFDFGWLDEVIEKLGKKGIKIVLSTPTAGPPVWLLRRYPDVFPVNYKGQRIKYGDDGGGVNYCHHNPNFLRCVERIIRKMARHYKDNSHVFCWQIDNELSWHDHQGMVCYCNHTQEAFREWLKKRYKSIDSLNEIYGNICYVQEYEDWGDIEPPIPPLDRKIPGLAFDWLKFRSGSMVKYAEFQKSIIQSEAPHQTVTTNQMGFFGQIDYYSLGKAVDFVSNDHYPKWVPGEADPVKSAQAHDGTRNMGKEKYFWLMEAHSGAMTRAKTPRPGEIRKFTYQAMSRGMNGILYFRWRTIPFGQEQFCHGIFNHDNRINRKYEEVKKIGRELSSFAESIMDTAFRAEAAILYSYDSRWSAELDNDYFNTTYVEEVYNAYKGLWANHVPTDIINPNCSFNEYKILFVPFGYLVDSNLASRLIDYVKEGGMLIATARCAVKDEYNRVFTEPLPGLLRDLFGVTIEDFDRVEENEEKEIVLNSASPFLSNKRFKSKGWIEVLEATKAKIIGNHSGDWTNGKPAVTINDYGKGKAVYIGTFMDYEASKMLVGDLINCGKIGPFAVTADTDGEIEIVKRKGKDFEVLFVINHSAKDKSVEINLQKEYSIKELTTDFTASRSVIHMDLLPDDVRIFRLR